MLRIHNTLSGQKEEFVPQSGRKVKMYVCGPTVYDQSHIGHARAYVAMDVTRRYLEHLGYSVFYAVNFTDIDDKILAKCKETGDDPALLSAQLIKDYLRDMDALSVKRASLYPKVSDHIHEIQEAIQRIVASGKAYVSGNSVYFRVNNEGVGPLSKQRFSELKAGARIAIDQAKENPADFALWKEDQEWGWQSPWGKGRPGWHIECSVMGLAYLGPTLDIHAGGNDLVFPHHECEILQSESLTGRPFCRYWMHNGMLQMGEEKMAKSLKNFITIQDGVKEFGADILRFYLVYTQYRKPILFSHEALAESKVALGRLKGAVARLRSIDGSKSVDVSRFEKGFYAAMDDDLNTRDAISVLFQLAEDAEGAGGESRSGALKLFDSAGEILGINWEGAGKGIEEVVDIMLELRSEARKRKDFETADHIRSRLKEIGIIVEDIDEKSTWHRG